MKITVDDARVEAVLGRLMDTYTQNAYPYWRPDVMVPQDPRNLPEAFRDPAHRDNLAYSMYLFCLCYYMRGGIKSTTAARSLSRLYEAHPDWFNASVAARMDPGEIRAELENFGLNFNKKQIPEFWVKNAGRLVKHWCGDPRAIFEGVTTFEQACHRIKNDHRDGGFLGFQEKMVSMIIYYLMDEELIDFFYFPIPIDLHVLRVTASHGLIRFSDVPEDGNRYRNETLATVRKLFLGYAIRHQINPLRLCDAVWLLSESLCSDSPGNMTTVDKDRNGRKTKLTPVPVTWNPAQVAAYKRSCGQCPVEQTCETAIPSADYYVRGVLSFRGPRPKPPSWLFSGKVEPPAIQAELF